MAGASVTLKTSPFELQIISAALRVYAEYAKAKAHKEYEPNFEGAFRPTDGDPRRAMTAAQQVKNDLGLRG